MRLNTVINSNTLREELPNTIKVSDDESLSVKETSVFINEIDCKATPFIPKEYDKCFSVGVKALVERRIYKTNEAGYASVTVSKDQIGDFVYLTEDASIKDVMNAINDLVRKISNTNA